MRRALELAERGRGRVSPNPPVGCVLVRDGEIVAEGWHDRLGELHAEQAAIADAEERGVATEGTTAYVTLEPCNHHGLTPPCTQALLWAGVSEVVIGTRDPNPMVRGDGVATLKEAGIEVRVGVLETEAWRQMQAFMRWCETRRPLVTIKAAMDANGVVDSEGEPARFTSDESLDLVHRLRRDVDAVAVGIGTVLRDDPSLTVRRVPSERQPLRVVLDSRGRTPMGAAILDDGAPTLIVTSTKADSKMEGTIALPPSEEGVDPEALLDLLGDRGIQELLIEGGPSAWSSFLDGDLVDRAIVIRAPVDLGNGPGAGIDSGRLEEAGLRLEREFDSGVDRVQAWSRPDLPWPNDEWP